MKIQLVVSEDKMVGKLLDRREQPICQLSLPWSEDHGSDVEMQIRMLLSMGNITREVLKGVTVWGTQRQKEETESILQQIGIHLIQ